MKWGGGGGGGGGKNLKVQHSGAGQPSVYCRMVAKGIMNREQWLRNLTKSFICLVYILWP